MINLYGYTYRGAMTEIPGYVLVKLGDSSRDVEIRMNEQGGAAEYQAKITVGEWNNLKQIKRDHLVHKELKRRGLYHKGGQGTEWFKIPGTTIEDAYAYLDKLITELEGKKVRNKVTLRNRQQIALDEAMAIIANSGFSVNAIAYLCPRFGKTIWSMMLFNEIHKQYGNRIMLLPAYWLSVHPSFEKELDLFEDFLDIDIIDARESNSAALLKETLKNGRRAIIPISLHQTFDVWKTKYQWLTKLDKKDLFVFADEGDFGTYAENQKEKLKLLLDIDSNSTTSSSGKFIKMFASGTNIQRLAKCCDKIDGVVYTAYSQLEQSEIDIVRRKFYMSRVDKVKAEVEKFDVTVMPSWTKIWDKPLGNSKFIEMLLQSIVGDDTLRTELNLSNLANEPVDCFMLLVSANNNQMDQIKAIAKRAIPNWKVKVLNGNYSTNRSAEDYTVQAINEAKIENKRGVIIVANQMGSRSYSIPEIQATVIAYDRGSVDATTQKVSRCLTPGKTFDDRTKIHGHIIDLSFDPNRSENIERLILDEAIQVQRGNKIDFTSAIKFVLSSINLFNVDDYGFLREVRENDLFKLFSNNENLLKIADITVDVEAALESGVFDILCNVNADKGKKSIDKKLIVGEGVKNSIIEGQVEQQRKLTDNEKQAIEKTINNAIRTLNMSATSVYNLAETGDSYRECLSVIADHSNYNRQFKELFGVSASDTLVLIEKRVLNEAILDVVVQNSKHLYSPFFESFNDV